MKVLLVCDKFNWSYHAIALALQKHNPYPDITLDILSWKGDEERFWKIEKEYDRILIMAHQILDNSWKTWWRIDPNRWLVGIHSHHAFDDLKTTPEKDVDPPTKLMRFLAAFKGVNTVSQRLAALFKANGLVDIFCTENGVDVHTFRPYTPLRTTGKLRVGFAGTAKGVHDFRKGFNEYIIPACNMANVELVTAVARTGTALTPEQMPNFYNSIDIYLCASSSEGFSISVLEAASCGRPVISTRVGGSTELITHGRNGFLVNRSVTHMFECLNYLDKNRDKLVDMGRNMRHTVEQHWDWKLKSRAWMDFIRHD